MCGHLVYIITTNCEYYFSNGVALISSLKYCGSDLLVLWGTVNRFVTEEILGRLFWIAQQDGSDSSYIPSHSWSIRWLLSYWKTFNRVQVDFWCICKCLHCQPFDLNLLPEFMSKLNIYDETNKETFIPMYAGFHTTLMLPSGIL